MTDPNDALHLITDLRARHQIAAMDANYVDFARRLPPPLNELALHANTFKGRGGEGAAFGGPSTMNPGLTCTPWLMWEMFGDLDDQRMLDIAGAGALLVLASAVLDHIVDVQSEQTGYMLLLHQALQEEGTSQLRRLFAAAAPVWQALDRFSAEHIACLVAELNLRSAPDQLSWETFKDMARGKFSPILITPAALVEAAGRPEWLSPIEASVKHLAVAAQLLDDIGDWTDDLPDRHLTYFLSRLAPPEAWSAATWPSQEALEQQINASWLDSEELGRAVEWLDRSIEALQGLDCPAWIEYLRGYRILADEQQTLAMARHLMRTLAPVVGKAS